MYKILIVEDDQTITDVLERHLTKWNYQVSHVTNFDCVLETFVEDAPDLVLLDISLPFFNGFYWCSEIRKVSKVPIMFLSSASDNMNVVMAMNMGADDFIAKPFDLEVVIAKIQAILRRAYSFGGQTHLLEHKGAVFNLSEASILYQGEKLDLTRNDFKILQLLLENKGHTVSRDSIIKRLWESDSFIDDNTLTVNMTRLRKKLDSIGLNEFIVTRKGLGYIIEE